MIGINVIDAMIDFSDGFSGRSRLNIVLLYTFDSRNDADSFGMVDQNWSEIAYLRFSAIS